jgi:hypothetical protein
MRIPSLVSAVAGSLVLLSAGQAYASWTGSGSGSGAAAVTALAVPTSAGTGTATTSSVVLSWSAPSGGAPVASYQVLRGGSLVTSGGCAAPVTATTCTDTGLNPSTAYSWTVRAVRNSWTGVATGAFGSSTLSGVTITSPTSSSAVLTRNTTLNVVVSGTGFVSGVGAALSAPGPDGFSLVSVTYNSATQVTLRVSTPAGNGKTSSFTLTNPDGGSATCTNCLRT